MPRSNATRVGSGTKRLLTVSALCAVLAASGGPSMLAQAPAEALLVVANGSSAVGFGSEPIGVAGTPKAVLLQNAGTASLTFGAIDLTGLNAADYTVASNGCSTLAPGGTCSIAVQFKPSGPGARNARLRIVDNASGSPHLVPLLGSGIDPAARPKIIGPIDARTGYPKSITDQNGVTLDLCWDDPAFCLTTLPDPTQPPSVRDEVVNFPDESFWFSAEAQIDPWPLGKRALLVLAQEAAFVGDLVPGGQAMFGRVRIRVDGLKPLTTYRFTHPYGRDLITTDDLGEIFSTEDIGCLSTPCDYSLALTSRVWPFLKWDPAVLPAAPAGHLGDFNVLHPIVGSPIGQNLFRIEEVDGSNFRLVGETNLFAVSGKLGGATTTPPPPPATSIVPDVLLLLQSDAQSSITAAGLTFAVTSASSSTVAAGRVISQSPSGGVSVPTGSAVAIVVSSGPSVVAVPNVVGQSQAIAQSSLTAAGLTNGPVSTSNHATIPAGSVISQNPAAGLSVVPGTPVSLVVSLGPVTTSQPPTAIASGFSDGTGARSVTISTSAPGAVLVALIASDGPTSGANNQFITVAGGGLAWTRVQRAAVQRGVAEIWTATAPAALASASITATQSVTTVLGGPVNQSLYVVAFANASGIGASNIASGATGAPRVTAVTQGEGSAIYGVGIDFDRAVARTVPTTQTKLHEFLAPSGDTMWMQSLIATTAAAGTTVTLNDTAPTTDQWNFAIVEIKR